MTTTQQYATAQGISARRARALAESGAIPAHRSGRVWVIDSAERPVRAAVPRPMGAPMRRQLIDALRDQSLVGLTGPDRLRVARHLRQLRDSDNPADLLRAWFRGEVPGGWSPGELIVRQAQEGVDDRVSALVTKGRRKFMPSSERLARVVSDERAIQGLSAVELARRAEVGVDVITELERARPGVGIGETRRILRALDVTPLALPPVTVGHGS